jgi:hypothetical protein
LITAFARVFPWYLTLLFAYALIQLFRGVNGSVSWLGLALSALGPLIFFMQSRGVSATAEPTALPLMSSMIGGLGLAICMAVSWRYGPAAGWAHAWAGSAMIGWWLYLQSRKV